MYTAGLLRERKTIITRLRSTKTGCQGGGACGNHYKHIARRGETTSNGDWLLGCRVCDDVTALYSPHHPMRALASMRQKELGEIMPAPHPAVWRGNVQDFTSKWDRGLNPSTGEPRVAKPYRRGEDDHAGAYVDLGIGTSNTTLSDHHGVDLAGYAHIPDAWPPMPLSSDLGQYQIPGMDDDQAWSTSPDTTGFDTAWSLSHMSAGDGWPVWCAAVIAEVVPLVEEWAVNDAVDTPITGNVQKGYHQVSTLDPSMAFGNPLCATPDPTFGTSSDTAVQGPHARPSTAYAVPSDVWAFPSSISLDTGTTYDEWTTFGGCPGSTPTETPTTRYS